MLAASVPTGVATAAGTALPDITACSYRLCFTVLGDSAAFTLTAQGRGFYGYIQLRAPGINYRGPSGPDPTATVEGRGSGTACAQGWERQPDGTFTSIGMTCMPIPAA
jgi:hypothetical protein